MKIKTSRIEKAFLLGVGFHYLATRSGGFMYALSKEVQDRCKAARIEHERIVDPYNRDVVE